MFTIPHLRVQTTRLPSTPELAQLLTAKRGQIAWLKNRTGFVCAGQAARCELGPSSAELTDNGRRFALASQWWKDLQDNAEIRDDLALPGTGLVALGSFSFVPNSPAGSTLIVPQVIVGITGPGTGTTTAGTAFLTLIGPDDQDIFETLDEQSRALLDAVLVGTELHYDSSGIRQAQPRESLADYRQHVAQIKSNINASTLTKAVLARQLDITSDSPIDERHIVAQLAGSYDDCWTFGIDGLIGATPELLAQSEGNQVVTRVLAGTFPNTEAYDDDALLNSAKNMHEHEVAVVSAVDSLQKLGEVQASQPFVLRLPNVSHLATDIVTTLAANTDVLSVTGLLHPTAALGGTPTDKALELITKLEATDRDRFGAPVGWIGSYGAGQWCVALRCARIDDELHARAWAGGGIMADSDPDEEYAETQAKFDPIMGALGIAL
ncbi:isochorismate synthase [Arcanobacterium phocae]|uniref:isochorismate synthase n=1 Tax=Arcanobacterium phocae TaxID=131112 RepID=UPI001C0E94EC|nr:isochorismate synthase [Arcanobacterium phocae]